MSHHMAKGVLDIDLPIFGRDRALELVSAPTDQPSPLTAGGRVRSR